MLFANPATDYARALAAAAPRLHGPATDLPPVGHVPLEAAALDVSFRRPRWRKGRIDGVCTSSLDIRRGSAVALVCGSGWATPTLARAVAALAPVAPGAVRCQGR